MTKVGFPGLGIAPFELNPVAFSIGSMDVRWYGVIIAAGFFTALLLTLKLAKNDREISQDNVLDIVLWGFPSAIIGARLYYVAFNFSIYHDNFWNIFKIREGGLAIYGAIIAGIISTYLYCKHKKINFAAAFDVCCPGLVTGQLIGRWGNFMNAEAFGRETDLPWRMSILESFSNAEIIAHPTFLYESLWNSGVLALLLVVYNRRKFSGQVFLTYVTAYGLGRFWIEGLRTDSLYIGQFRVSQILALLSAAAAFFALLHFSRKKVL